MSLVKDIELPSPEVMAQRVMAATGAEDEYQVAQMVQVVWRHGGLLPEERCH